MWPQEAITDRLASPDLPSLLLHDPDLTRIVRRSGGTIAWDGQPLTTVGWRRIRQWRREWLALPSQVVPAVTGPDQVVRPGIQGLRDLARAPHRRALPAAPARACRNRAAPDTRPADDPGRRDRAAGAAVTGGGPAQARHAASGEGRGRTGRAARSRPGSVHSPAAGSDTADGYPMA